MSLRSPRSFTKRVTVAPKRSDVNAACRISTAEPDSERALALAVWWSAAAVGRGMRIAGIPHAESSAVVIAPARVTAMSAAQYASDIGEMNGTTRRNGASSPAYLSKLVLPVAQIIRTSPAARRAHSATTLLIPSAPWLPPKTRTVCLGESSNPHLAEISE
jgi:hypothetical protein